MILDSNSRELRDNWIFRRVVEVSFCSISALNPLYNFGCTANKLLRLLRNLPSSVRDGIMLSYFYSSRKRCLGEPRTFLPLRTFRLETFRLETHNEVTAFVDLVSLWCLCVF